MNDLSLDRINKFAPYKVVKTPNDDFWFSTIYGVNYSVAFNEEFELGGCMAYQFGIFNKDNRHTPYDANIQATIVAIINEFFRVNHDVLLYICDNKDKREEARNRLFFRWLKQEDKDNKYCFDTSSAFVEGQEIIVSIIVERNNPQLHGILKEFKVVSNVLGDKP